MGYGRRSRIGRAEVVHLYDHCICCTPLRGRRAFAVDKQSRSDCPSMSDTSSFSHMQQRRVLFDQLTLGSRLLLKGVVYSTRPSPGALMSLSCGLRPHGRHVNQSSREQSHNFSKLRLFRTSPRFVSHFKPPRSRPPLLETPLGGTEFLPVPP